MVDFAKLKTLYSEQIDLALAQMGKNCKLIFPSKVTNVTSNFNDPTRNQGTLRPTYGATNDADKPVTVPKTLTIKALVEWNPRNMKTYPDIKISEGDNIIKVKTKLEYADDINRCEFLEPNIESASYHQAKFRLVKSVNPRGLVNDRYIVSFWKEIND